MKKEVLDDNKELYQEKLEQAKLGAFDMSMEFARSIADDLVKLLLSLYKNSKLRLTVVNMILLKSLKGYAKQLTGTDLASDGISPVRTARSST